MRQKIILLAVVIAASVLYGNAQTVNTNKPSSPALSQGKGTLSFKLNGKVYHTDTSRTKCWTTPNIPVAILWSSGSGLDISWKILDIKGKGIYKIDRDSRGSVNFFIAGKTYWIRKTDGSNYITITITAMKDLYGVKLLSGTFEGIIEDKDGNKVQITEGKFTTEGI
jgi:hypothetical protein